MSEKDFENGYWYAVDLKRFAQAIGILGASSLRKDELEQAIGGFLRTGKIKSPTKRALKSEGVRDSERGLSLRLHVRRYINDAETKQFIIREAEKIVPHFKHAPGTKYLLNRWREKQLTRGKKITYGDIVRQAIHLNQTKKGPLRTEHGRYNNFTSDYLASHKGATQKDVAKAWNELKMMDVPKTYAAYANAKSTNGRSA